MGILAMKFEQIRPEAKAREAKVAFFDFDGTLSLVRSGWMDVMVPMMVEILANLKTGETIYQMIEFAQNVEKRGGKALEPLEYKKMYLDLLWERIRGRVEELKSGHVPPEKYMVPGTRALLESLKERGLKMYLASGTDEVYMKEEARLIDVAKYFDGGVYGALDDYKSFSKKILVQRILAGADVRGEEIIGFGDGYVEIEEVKLVGGVAVGVASTEPECMVVDEWKRQRLIGVGADYIVPNYLCRAELLEALFGSDSNGPLPKVAAP
jgi:phosphoglycolate phosphatase